MTTGGSMSIRSTWDPLRKAGASARDMLLTAAAETWSVPKDECSATGGSVIEHKKVRSKNRHMASSRSKLLRAGAQRCSA